MPGRIKSVQKLPRYKQVANLLIKYGYGSIVDHISFWTPKRKRLEEEGAYLHFTGAQRLRHLLEELGPTFIKIGQLLSTRPDLMGPEYIAELENLQDNVDTFSFEEAVPILEQTGIDVERDFQSFNPRPIAAASIAQVYEARLPTGEDIVLKVQRPGIEDIVATDLAILKEMSGIVEKRTHWGKFYHVTEVVQELSDAIWRELDFRIEAQNAETFYQNSRANQKVIIPRVYQEFTSQRVLALEKVEGIKIQDIIHGNAEVADREQLVNNFISIMFDQVFEDGFFHADPHPGNIAVGSGGRVILYDFGQVGEVDNHIKEQATDLVLGMMRYDAAAVARTLQQLCYVEERINQEELLSDLELLEHKYYSLPLAQINMGTALSEIIQISMKHKLRIPSQLSLLAKMMMTIESWVTQIDPQISLVKIAEPYGKRILQQRFTWSRFRRTATAVGWDYLELGQRLPKDIANLLRLLASGDFKVKLEIPNSKRILNQFDIITNRIVLAIILASIIMGTSLMAWQRQDAVWVRLPLVELGFSAALLLGLFLVYSIIKRGRY